MSPIQTVSQQRAPMETETTRPSVFPLRPFGRNRFKSRNFIESLGFALEGLSFIYRTQGNFRIDTAVGIAVTILGLVLRLHPLEWAPLIVVMALVLFGEALNTAIEYTVDLYTQGEFDMRAKVIKDVSAGACLLMAISAAVTGSVIFIPHLLGLLH